jgi:hypothetical protein
MLFQNEIMADYMSWKVSTKKRRHDVHKHIFKLGKKLLEGTVLKRIILK